MSPDYEVQVQLFFGPFLLEMRLDHTLDHEPKHQLSSLKECAYNTTFYLLFNCAQDRLALPGHQ